ncbi:hypothetical protein [Brasilonema sp. UFV-L1]|uniref:hypothetical protein n=1 Tax=Brasilonema sp. UFV-L1 TaxID=2234130 RepID=UPI00145DC101|nr:hypothetical protein [Brasilonema sp. UFV-L1]NMG11634.1 hypothetical protein [Brasilonema sp. UFV-L1]
MLTTYELRWFNPGTVPQDIKFWFEQNCLISPRQPPEEREDLYLYSPGCDFLGVKLRHGRLEVKWRKAELGIMYFGDFVQGRAEKWGKWLCCDDTQESFHPNLVLGNSSWISVQKVRYSQRYQVLREFSPQPVSTKAHIDNGCTVELTHLMIQENFWWSLAFEAFGEDAYLMDNLQTTASWVFKSYRELKLPASHSYAFPSWLALVYR